jgi:hypothetical protein
MIQNDTLSINHQGKPVARGPNLMRRRNMIRTIGFRPEGRNPNYCQSLRRLQLEHAKLFSAFTRQSLNFQCTTFHILKNNVVSPVIVVPRWFPVPHSTFTYKISRNICIFAILHTVAILCTVVYFHAKYIEHCNTDQGEIHSH